MIYVEIPKLKKTKEELSTHLEWWLYVFQNLNEMQEVPPRLKGDVIEKAFERAEFINLPKSEQDKYHKNLKVYRDLINSIDTAHEEGKIEGKIEGKLEGKLEGKIEVAKVSLAQGLDIGLISQITGLSIEEIEDLKKSSL